MRGGYRENAGRKPTGRRKIGFYITEQEEAHLREELERLRTIEAKLEQETGQQRLIENPSRPGYDRRE